MPISESACGLRNSMHHPGNAGLAQIEVDAGGRSRRGLHALCALDVMLLRPRALL